MLITIIKDQWEVNIIYVSNATYQMSCYTQSSIFDEYMFILLVSNKHCTE